MRGLHICTKMQARTFQESLPKKKKKGKKNSKKERRKERSADGAATTVEWPLDK